ncbi:MAG TPA: DUF2163 domain-containing protein [Alphaproteobacteria bacterium]|nr:DUF2163 domain-containing protein [Alphaproteobacteria bacterium]
MKTASSALQTLLAGGQFYMADLYTFTLVGGGVLRYTDAEIDVAANGFTFTSEGPVFDRTNGGTAEWKLGLEVDTFDITVLPGPDDTMNGAPFLSALRMGMLDGATVQVERAFMASWGDTSAGTVILFLGRVGEVDAGRTQATIHVNSHLELFDIAMPRNLYQPSCVNTLYDGSCTASRAAFAVTSSVAAGSSQTDVLCALTQAAGWFDLGVLEATGGGNAGFARMVKCYTPGSFTLVSPFPVAFAVGDPFTAYAGCDKTQATCQSKFNNLAHFKGFPYIPPPETAR